MLEHVQRVREARRKPQSVVVSARSDGGKPAGVARLLGDARTLGRVAIIAVCDKGDPRRKLSGQLGSRDVLQAALAPQAAEAIGNALPLGERLDAESAVRLVETYDAAESEYLSLRLPFQTPVQYKRSVLVSYLDEEMLVVRDALGRPDVLMRCDATASSWPPSSLGGDDGNQADDAPGAS